MVMDTFEVGLTWIHTNSWAQNRSHLNRCVCLRSPLVGVYITHMRMMRDEPALIYALRKRFFSDTKRLREPRQPARAEGLLMSLVWNFIGSWRSITCPAVTEYQLYIRRDINSCAKFIKESLLSGTLKRRNKICDETADGQMRERTSWCPSVLTTTTAPPSRSFPAVWPRHAHKRPHEHRCHLRFCQLRAAFSCISIGCLEPRQGQTELFAYYPQCNTPNKNCHICPISHLFVPTLTLLSAGHVKVQSSFQSWKLRGSLWRRERRRGAILVLVRGERALSPDSLTNWLWGFFDWCTYRKNHVCRRSPVTCPRDTTSPRTCHSIKRDLSRTMQMMTNSIIPHYALSR